jgi:hypothetical protein
MKVTVVFPYGHSFPTGKKVTLRIGEEVVVGRFYGNEFTYNVWTNLIRKWFRSWKRYING